VNKQHLLFCCGTHNISVCIFIRSGMTSLVLIQPSLSLALPTRASNLRLIGTQHSHHTPLQRERACDQKVCESVRLLNYKQRGSFVYQRVPPNTHITKPRPGPRHSLSSICSSIITEPYVTCWLLLRWPGAAEMAQIIYLH
jgi:hypothetical protein